MRSIAPLRREPILDRRDIDLTHRIGSSSSVGVGDIDLDSRRFGSVGSRGNELRCGYTGFSGGRGIDLVSNRLVGWRLLVQAELLSGPALIGDSCRAVFVTLDGGGETSLAIRGRNVQRGRLVEVGLGQRREVLGSSFDRPSRPPGC